MTLPDHITPEAYEWAEIFMDAHRGVEDDRELLALAFIALRGRPVKAGLTVQQAAALSFIEDYQAKHQASPSYSEIQLALGYSSKSGVHRLVHSLADRGAISLLRDRSRSIALVGRAA